MAQTMPDPRLKLYQEAGLRAAAFTVSFQQPDGGYIWEGYPSDAFHKQAYSWGLAGAIQPAHRLLSWVKRERLGPDGRLRDYRGDVYKHCWLTQGAHRLGRFDLSYPIAEFIASCQAPCGGLPHFEGDQFCRSLSTGIAGLVMLYMGRVEEATRIAQWCIDLVDQQPDDSRFYYRTSLDGKLATGPGAMAIDNSQPGQVYWEIGLPLQVMCKMHQATGESSYLQQARRFFERHLSCAEDRFSFTGSGKSALGAALYYALTGDGRARAAAIEFGDFLLRTQLPDGAWRNPNWPPEVLYSIDAAAEFNVWLQEIAATVAAGDGKGNGT